MDGVINVFENLTLQVFENPSYKMMQQLVPKSMEDSLTWSKLCTINFVSTQDVNAMLSKIRKKIVMDLNQNVLTAISAAVEEIRIAPGSLFNLSRRFPDGIHVAWIPAHPMIQSLCVLQKICVCKIPDGPMVCAKLLAVIENIENYLATLEVATMGVYDRDKFERTVARWGFNWATLSYQYEIIETLRRS